MTAIQDETTALYALPTLQSRRWHPADRRRLRHSTSYTQGALALTYPLGIVEAAPTSTALTVVKVATAAPSPIPCPEQWASRFLQAVIEVISSDRPLKQLARWTDPQVYADIARRKERVATSRGNAAGRVNRQQVATVHICQPTADVAEVAARVTLGPKSRALAARLDYRRDRWTCTALEFC